MGASGAGKTTYVCRSGPWLPLRPCRRLTSRALPSCSLLDVLADRKTIGVIEGDVLINGRPIGMDFQRGTAYVEQQDVHEWTTTVREAFRVSAYLRQPYHVSKEDKDAYCEEILQLLSVHPRRSPPRTWRASTDPSPPPSAFAASSRTTPTR